MAQQWYRAQDTFAAELADGSHVLVNKGDTLPGGHELVKRDAEARKRDHGTPLFALLDAGEPEQVTRARAQSRKAAG